MFITVLEGQALRPGTQRQVVNRSLFGNPSIVPTGIIRVPFLDDGGTFGAPSVRTILSATAGLNLNSFGVQVVHGSVAPSCVINGNAFGSHGIGPVGAVYPSLEVNVSVFGSPRAVSKIHTSVVMNVDAFGTNSVFDVGYLSPAAVVNVSTFGADSAETILHDTEFVNANGFGSPTISLTGQIFPSRVSNVNSIAGPRARDLLHSTAMTNAQAFGAPTLTMPLGASILEVPFTAPPTIAGGSWTALDIPTLQPSPTDITINGVQGIRVAGFGYTSPLIHGITIPKPGAAYQITARLRRNLPMNASSYVGLVLQETSSGKFQTFGWTPSGLGDARVTTSSDFGAALVTTTPVFDTWAGTASGDYDDWEGWFRIVRTSSGQYQYWISQDGHFWSKIKSYILTGPGFTVEADRVGIAMSPYGLGNPVGQPLNLDCFSWEAHGSALGQSQVVNTNTFGSPTIGPVAAQVVQAKAFFNALDWGGTLNTTPTPGNWLIVVGQTGSSSTPTTASGWTRDNYSGGGGSFDNLGVYVRRVQAGDTATFAPVSGGAGGSDTAAGLVCWEVKNLPSTWAAAKQYEDQRNGSTSGAVSSHACTSDNTLALGYCGETPTGNGNLSLTSGWTQDAAHGGSLVGGTGRAFVAGHELLTHNGDSSSSLNDNAGSVDNTHSLLMLFLNHA